MGITAERLDVGKFRPTVGSQPDLALIVDALRLKLPDVPRGQVASSPAIVQVLWYASRRRFDDFEGGVAGLVGKVHPLIAQDVTMGFKGAVGRVLKEHPYLEQYLQETGLSERIGGEAGVLGYNTYKKRMEAHARPFPRRVVELGSA
jgi:hypothetical protein